MSFVFEFDIAALVVSLVLICFYFQKQQLKSLQNKSFLAFAFCLIITSVLEMVITLLVKFSYSVPNWILWAAQCTYLSFSKAFGMIFAIYCVGLSNILYEQNLKLRRFLDVLLIVPYIGSLAIIWLSPIFYEVYPLIFEVDYLGRPLLNRSPFWYNCLYAISGYYVIFSISFVISQRKRVELIKRIVLYICAILAFLAVIVQVLFPRISIECFALAVAALIFFFFLQNPEEMIDSVTKIFNQQAFVRLTSWYFHKNTSFTCVSILIGDTVFLSHTFGVTQMNSFLKEVAQFLKENFSDENTFCINQNCFCLVFTNPEPQQVKAVVERLQERFQKNWFYNSMELKLYIRECVIECPRCAKKSEEILDILNLVATDERYKQPVVYANEVDLEYKRRNDYIEYALKNGISRNRFDVYYQPIFSTADKRVIGAEALIRLKDEKGRFLSPEDFIPIAEKTGTILRIGEYVFEQVCRAISQIDLEEYGIKKIDINLSVAQCMQEILSDQILSIQNIYQIPASIINLEITETAAAHTPEILLRNMEKLASAGFELSLDDYGAGYSNMNYLLNLPFKMVKIDKYIVWSAFTDEKAKKALTATVQMIKSLGMMVLAEGVEDKAQATMLADLGCDYLQGYYFSRPISKNQFLTLMKTQKENPQELL